MNIKLTKYQRAAATHYKGPALVLAGPGSGKTTVLTQRVRYLIEERDVSPEKILVVTFARFAAAEMKERFLKLTSGKYNSVTFSTIHSVCYSILNSKGSFEDYRLLSEQERSKFLSETIKKYFAEHPGRLQSPGLLKDVIKYISKQGTKSGSVSESSGPGNLFEYCAGQLKLFKEKNLFFDFDDMAKMTEDLLSSEGRNLLNRFEYVMVDEFQDTAADQFSLLKLLCKDDNFYAVGDEDQSVYGFRGACPEIMLNFREYFNDCRIYDLPENFRSHEKIVDASNCLIKNNKMRYGKSTVSAVKERFEGGDRVLSGYNETEELDLLISEIRKALKTGETMAVLVRTRGTLDLVAGKLIQSEIGFNIRDRINNIFEVPVVRTVLSFFRVSEGCGDSDDHIRVFRTTDIRGYESLFATGIKDNREILSFYQGDEKVADLLFRVESLKNFAPAVGLEFIRNVMGLDMKISVYDRSKLDELGILIKGLQNIKGLFEFEKTYKGLSEMPSDNNKLTLATIHSSKGLEFDRVFVPYVNEGCIPSPKAVSDGETEEERRLFYVAITRAKKEVVLSHHESARGKKTLPSRFLREIKPLEN